MSAYQNLFRQFEKIADLKHVQSISFWDEASMMPTGGGEVRGQALATLAVVIYELKTDPRAKDWLEQAKGEDLDEMQTANVREMTREYHQATCLTAELVRRLRLVSSRCEQAWRQYRSDNNWTDMQPLLQEVIALTREEAAMRAESTGMSLYDAMLDVHEPGMNVKNWTNSTERQACISINNDWLSWVPALRALPTGCPRHCPGRPCSYMA